MIIFKKMLWFSFKPNIFPQEMHRFELKPHDHAVRNHADLSQTAWSFFEGCSGSVENLCFTKITMNWFWVKPSDPSERDEVVLTTTRWSVFDRCCGFVQNRVFVQKKWPGLSSNRAIFILRIWLSNAELMEHATEVGSVHAGMAGSCRNGLKAGHQTGEIRGAEVLVDLNLGISKWKF